MGYGSFLWAYAKLHIKSAAAYKFNFLFQALFMMLNNFFFLLFWYFIFQKIDTLNGWGMSHLMLLFAAGALSFGFLSFFLGNWRSIHKIVSEGELDFYLALPKDELLHALVSRSSFYGVGDMAFGIIVYLIFTGLSFPTFLSFLIYCFFGAIVWSSILVIVQSLAFVFGKIEGIYRMADTISFAATTYPYSIFPAGLRVFFFVIFPAFFISNIPVILLQGFSWKWFLLLLGVTIITASLAWFLFRVGLKRYESGNLLTVRV